MKKPEHLLEVHRPNILVADMERSLRIYRDIIGFKVNFLLDALDVAYEMFGLPRAAKLRMAFISEGKGAFGSLALTAAEGVELELLVGEDLVTLGHRLDAGIHGRRLGSRLCCRHHQQIGW